MSDNENDNAEGHRPEDDSFKILIATDCHLGYEEKSSRGEDSFTTFEEILKYGKQNNVDFILLGGDLFHDNKPTQSTVMKCIDLLRKYCLGPRPNKFQFLTDPKAVFKHCSNKSVNFEDPNLNVEIPVFSIHGNHDDPSGAGQIGSLDLLSVTGLVNYFGKWTNLSEVKVLPLLFKKGCTHLALYGLSYIKDQRLSRLLRDGKVDMLRPNEIQDCFNVFVLHQNRAKHSDNSFIPEENLPNFLDFVLWGHEHECRIDPEPSGKKNFRVCQPGSPVATSLCQGEAVPKHVGILHVYKTSFKLKKLKLKTVRPFVFDTVHLTDNKDIKTNAIKKLSNSIEKYIDNYIENVMMPKAVEQLTGDPSQPTLPLLRLRVTYSEDEEKFETFRLDQKYLDQVANAGDIILLRKQKFYPIKREGDIDIDDDDAIMEEALGYDGEEPEWNKTVQGGIKKYFSKENNKDKLTVLSVAGLNEALSQFVDKGDKNAFEDMIDHQMKIALDYINNQNLAAPEDIMKTVEEFRREREGALDNEADQARNFLNSSSRGVRDVTEISDDEETVESDDQNRNNDETPVRGRGRGRGRARGAKGAAQGRGRAKATASSSSTKTPVVSAPAKATRAAKQPAASTRTQSSRQPTVADFLSRSQANAKKTVFISDSDSD